MTTGVTCTVLVDGIRAADGSPGDDLAGPVILDDLSIAWGRSDTMSQPAAESCSFEVMDQLGGDSFMATYRTGRRVDVLARGLTYPDPTVETFANPGFEAASPVTWAASGGTATRTSSRVRSGGWSLAVKPTTAGTAATVLLAPGELQPPGTNPDAWDAIPATSPGQTWAASVSVWVPTGASATLRAALFTGPYAAAATPAGIPRVVIGDATWQTVSVELPIQVADTWLGLQVTLDPTGPSWDAMSPVLVWNAVDPARTWDELGSLFVDDVSVRAPSSVSGRGVLVFSGRITDLEAAWSTATDSPVAKVTAVGFTADLQNRLIGGEPWTVEDVDLRANRILTLAGLPITIDVDASIGSTLLSYRDVDAQGATGLLTEVATSVDGVLWPAVHQTIGAYLRLEDPAQRGSLLQLAEDDSGVPAELLATNLIVNPSFETNTTTWAPGGSVALSRIVGSTPEGSAYLRCTATAPGVTFGTLYGTFQTMTPGEPFLLSAAVRGVAGRTMNLRMRWNGGAASTVGAPFALTGGWQRVTLTGTVPGTATQGVPDVLQIATGSLTGDTFDVDAVLLVRGTSDTSISYFDGSKPDTATRHYAWTGTAHASTSTRSSIAVPDRIVVVQGDPDVGYDLSACVILRNPVTWVQDVSDVMTRVSVGWLVQGVDGDGLPTTTAATELVVDAALEAQYGTRGASISTQLQAATDAQDVAQRVLARSSPSGWRADGLTIDDDDVEGTPEGIALLLDLLDGTSRIGAPIVLGELPNWTPAGTDVGVYLEGGTYRYVGGRWVLELLVSSAGGLGQSAAWDELDPAWTWDQWSPDLSWNDLRGVAA